MKFISPSHAPVLHRGHRRSLRRPSLSPSHAPVLHGEHRRSLRRHSFTSMTNEPRKKLRLIIKFKKRGQCQPTGIFSLPENILYEEILLRVVQLENGYCYAESLRKVCQSFKRFLCEDYVLKRMNFWNAPIFKPGERSYHEKYVDACVAVGNQSAMYISCMTAGCFLFPPYLKPPSLHGIVDPQTIYLHSMLTFPDIRTRQAASESLQALLISSTKPNLETRQTASKLLLKLPLSSRKPNLEDYAVDIVLKLLPRTEAWSMHPCFYVCPLSPTTCCRKQTTLSRSGRSKVFMDACSISCKVYLEYEYFRLAQFYNLNMKPRSECPMASSRSLQLCRI